MILGIGISCWNKLVSKFLEDRMKELSNFTFLSTSKTSMDNVQAIELEEEKCNYLTNLEMNPPPSWKRWFVGGVERGSRYLANLRPIYYGLPQKIMGSKCLGTRKVPTLRTFQRLTSPLP